MAVTIVAKKSFGSTLKREERKIESGHQTYKRRFGLFVRSTDQKARQIETVKSIVATLPQTGHFLDVGAGTGEITEAVSAYFKRTTVVEPNPEYAKQLAGRFPEFQIYENNFDGVNLVGALFDFILCSHVLYYIPEKNWMAMIERMVFHLSEQGKLAIVLQSPEGPLPDLFRRLGGKTGEAVRLWGALVRRFGRDRVRAHYGVSRIKARSIHEMAEIATFLFHEKRFESKKPEIRRYFARNCKIRGGYAVEQDFITFEILGRGSSGRYAGS